MEMTTVPPSPASPTEGDDLCETDGTNVAIHSVTLLISLCGLVGNGAVLCLLSLKGHNTDIFDLAFFDFLFLLFTVPSALLLLVEDVSCSPIMPLMYLSFLFQLSLLSSYWALYQLTYSTSVVDMFRLCRRWGLPMRLSWLVDSVQYCALFALFTVIPAVTNLCPSHQQEQCRAALISVYAMILLLFAAPMVISSTIDFIKAKSGSKKQQPKRRDIIFFFIVLFIFLLILCNFLQDLGYIVVSSEVVFLLNCVHSSIKPFIYFLAGQCWRPCSLGSLQLSLQRVFDEQKGKTARSKNARKDTRSERLYPFPSFAEGIRMIASLTATLSDRTASLNDQTASLNDQTASLNNRIAYLNNMMNECAQFLPPRDRLLLQEEGVVALHCVTVGHET